MTNKEIETEIKSLQRKEYLIASNAGTYSPMEARRAVGSGDPAVATRNIYETVGGLKRSTGPRAEIAPGRMLSLSSRALGEDRKRVTDLQKMLKR